MYGRALHGYTMAQDVRGRESKGKRGGEGRRKGEGGGREGRRS